MSTVSPTYACYVPPYTPFYIVKLRCAWLYIDILSRKHRGSLAKFRSGTAPIKVETGRYQNLDLSERVCFHCASCIEDEEHVLMVCPIYEDLRLSLIREAVLINPDFEGLSDIQKMCF